MATPTDFDVISFIETYGITPLKNSSSITNIVNNLDNTYTILTGNTYSLISGDSITISELTDFNGSYKIDNIVSSSSFDIIKKYISGTGLTDISDNITIPSDYTNATWTDINPTFIHDRVDRLNMRFNDYPTELKTFPKIVLFEPLSRSYARQNIGYYDLTLQNVQFGFITDADDNWTIDQYYENSFEPMRLLALKFFNNIESYNSLDVKPIDSQITVDIISDIQLDEYFHIVAAGDTFQSFDKVVSGCVCQPISLTFRNAGKICYL